MRASGSASDDGGFLVKESNVNRREALAAALAVPLVGSLVRPSAASGQTVGGATQLPANGTLYVDPGNGADGNLGSSEAPVRTLAEAARRVNASPGKDAVTVILREGIHDINHEIEWKPERRAFTSDARLTIRAEILPDDPEWNVGRMPTLIHTMPLPASWNGRQDPLGGAANGNLVNTSHVTFRGLKILGLPVVETPKPGLKRRLYSIARLNDALDDLEVSQCLFVGDEVVAPSHVCIIARGNHVNVHHSIFRGFVTDAVVYWGGGSIGHAMRNCIFHGMWGSTVWTSGIGEDFVYRNNVVDSANYVWCYQVAAAASVERRGPGGSISGGTAGRPEDRQRYKAVDSLFAANRRIAGTALGAVPKFEDLDPSFIELVGTKVVAEPVVFDRDQTSRTYLHPVAGSETAKIGAGFFLDRG
jgi:hypothetical protein